MSKQTPPADRITRRQALALIALADAPTPNDIRFRSDNTKISIDLDRLTDVLAWAKVFGIAPALAEASLRESTLTHWKDSTGRAMIGTWLACDWRGWRVTIDADEPADGNVEPIDDDTRAQLVAVAGGETA